MINYQEQKMQTVLSNETTIQLIQIHLSSFLISCETSGIKHDDFGTIIHNIVNDVIDASDEDSPTRELKKPLLFLRAFQNFLNGIKVN